MSALEARLLLREFKSDYFMEMTGTMKKSSRLEQPKSLRDLLSACVKRSPKPSCSEECYTW